VKVEHKPLSERLSVTVEKRQQATPGKNYQQAFQRLKKGGHF
jgi:hypothetical protein